VLVASDASERTAGAFQFFSETAGIPCVEVEATRADIGNALGKRPCAVVAICDIGFAAALAKKLAESGNEIAKECLSEIEARARKISARKNKGKRKK